MKTVLKKLTAVVLVVFMAFGAAPIIGIDFSTQASAEKEGIYTYKVTDGKATITDCIDLVSGAINIPATLGGYPVTSIGVAAFHYSILLTSVNIPASVTSIGVSAFSDCESLTSINIPASVTSIGNYAFYECNSLTSIIIPEGVTSLGEYAFFYCTSLTSISIPTSVTSIGCAAFYNTAYYNNAANWTGDVLYIDNCLIDAKDTISGNYVVLAGTIIIADIAVADCTSLTSVTIPEGVTSIGSGAFSNCSYMTSITVASENPNYSSDEYGALFNKDKTTLIQYPIGNSRAAYQIPASVTSIVEEAFLNCDYLSSINIPVSVTSIGNHAFYDCFSLTSVTCDEGSQLTSIGDYAFMSCTQLASVHGVSYTHLRRRRWFRLP